MENTQHQAVSPDPKPGFLTKMTDLIAAPSEGFKEVVDHPDRVGPLAILAAAALISIPVALNQAQTLYREFPQLPAGNMNPIRLGVVALVFSLVVWFARGGIFHWLGMLQGAEMTWPQSLSVAGYLSLPNLIATLVAAVSILATGQSITLGLGMGMGFREALTVRGALMSQVNLFTLWYLFLSTIGLSRLWKTSKVKSGVITVALWLVVAAFQVFQAWSTAQSLQRLGM